MSNSRILCKLASAAVPGKSHVNQNIPCQDYVGTTRGKSVFAIALADGAGSASHADLGARVAVQHTLKYLRSNFDSLIESSEGEISAIIIKGALTALSRHANKQKKPLKDLASTLMFAATDGCKYLCGQLGDGRVAIFDKDLRSADSVFEPAKGEFFNETNFLTDAGAIARLRIQIGDASKIGGFALMSDGAEESLFDRSKREFAPALPKIISWLDTHSERKVKSALLENLSATLSTKTQDDISVALLRLI